MSISITRTGNGILNLTKELGRVRKFEPMLKEIGQSLESTTKLRFTNGVDPEGKKWVPRSPAYARQLARQGRLTSRVLVIDGSLQKSISYNADAKEVNIGTDKFYAEYHQEGMGNNPKRAFLGISKQDEQEIERIVQKHVEG